MCECVCVFNQVTIFLHATKSFSRRFHSPLPMGQGISPHPGLLATLGARLGPSGLLWVLESRHPDGTQQKGPPPLPLRDGALPHPTPLHSRVQPLLLETERKGVFGGDFNGPLKRRDGAEQAWLESPKESRRKAQSYLPGCLTLALLVSWPFFRNVDIRASPPSSLQPASK